MVMPGHTTKAKNIIQTHGIQTLQALQALQPFQVKVQHRPEKENGNANFLSRASTKWTLSRRKVSGCDGPGTCTVLILIECILIVIVRGPTSSDCVRGSSAGLLRLHIYLLH